MRIQLSREEIWSGLDKERYNVPNSQRMLLDSIRCALDVCNVDIIVIGDYLTAQDGDVGSLSDALHCIQQVIDCHDWLVEKPAPLFPEFEECAKLTGETYSQVRDKFVLSNIPSASDFALWYKRDYTVGLIAKKLRNQKDYRHIFDCGDLGVCNVSWINNKPIVEWLDKLERLED